MELSAIQIAELLDGEIEGSPNVVVNSLCKIEEGKPKALSFLSNAAYTQYLYNTKATLAMSIGEFKRAYVLFKKLPEFNNKLNEIEQEHNNLRIIAP